ncbi:MAG: DEAD/DEAH box helicase [Bryobacteraceae bacterium]
MIVVHASWLDGSLWLWAEGPERRGNLPASPWDAGPEALRTVILGAGATSEVRSRVRVEQRLAWLPSADDGPIPSSLLLGGGFEEGEVSLLPWLTSAAPLDRSARESLLMTCLLRRLGAETLFEPGVMIGDSFAFWAEAFQLASALVVRQQYLPDLVEVSGAYHARWTPLLDAASRKRFNDLASAMPGSARALATNPDKPPAKAPEAVLRGFLDRVVDEAVRSSAGSDQREASKASVHDQWLRALAGPKTHIKADIGKLKLLSQQIRDWRRPLELESATPYRLCFRLHEPKEEGRPDWRVEYVMQGRDDESVIIPSEAVWPDARGKQPGDVAIAAREQMLVSLGQAAALWPPVERSLRQREPRGFYLDTPSAFEFLSTTSEALEQSGFGVILPAWWSGQRTSQRLTAKASVKSAPMTAASGMTMNSLVEFKWKIALGEDELSLTELLELARLKTPLVRIRGQWIAVSPDEISAAVALLGKKGNNSATAGDLIRMAVGAGGTAEGKLEISGVEAEGEFGDVLAQIQGTRPFKELAPPPGLNAQLRPYQNRGYSWLDFLSRLGMGACLADDMGLGKTIQTLSLLESRREQQQSQAPVLLVCPTSVVGNWQREAARFTPKLTVMTHHGSDRSRGDAFLVEAARSDMVLSTYTLLQRDFELLNRVKWEGVILDEAQNIKNASTKQARAARALSAGYRAALTGTPVENNVGDLWSIFEFLNPGMLGSAAEFKKRFFSPIQMGRDESAAALLKRITGPFILRRLKTDKNVIADLPEKLEMNVYCNLTKEQASLYAAVVNDLENGLEGAEGIERKGLVLATLTKLKQVCNHPAHFLKDGSSVDGRSGKLNRLTEMIEEVLSEGDRALVFTQFAEMGEILRKHLEQTFVREVYFLHGSLTKKKRDAMVERFGKEGGAPIFILSLKAGGTGLNLVGANHVFHFDRWWNPAVEDQATDRAFRIGQTRNVQVHKFVCAGTLEEKIDAMIERKKTVAGQVVGAGEAWLTELSNDELRSLIALSKDALED